MSGPGQVRGEGAPFSPGLRRLAGGAMWTALATYLCLLAVPGAGFGVIPHALNAVSQCLPAVVCWLSLSGAGSRSREVVALSLALSAFAAGNVVLAVAEAQGDVLAVPSWADLGYISFYPIALVAIGLAARREHRDAGWAVWLDSCIGGLAAASIVAVLLRPAFMTQGHDVLATTVSLGYPTADLLLVFAVVSVGALREWQIDRRWLPLLAGLAVFAAADVTYDLQIAAHAYQVGSPLDGVWALGLSLMSMWAAPSPARVVLQPRRPVALAVSAAAAGLCLVVLVVGTLTRVAAVASVIAGLGIAGSILRTQHAFRGQERLSDLRREARTLERLVAAQDAERARIADDVHDDSLQALAAVDLRLGVLRRRLRLAASDEVDLLDTVIDSVHQAALRLRNLLFELEAPALDTDLPGALREAGAHLFGETDTGFSVIERGCASLPEAVRQSAYRIAREAMVNARKHAEASALFVSVDARALGVQVEVVDDGVGVAATTGGAERRRHSGVIGMHDRAAAAGGWWSSAPGSDGTGTHVSFFLPVRPVLARREARKPSRRRR